MIKKAEDVNLPLKTKVGILYGMLQEAIDDADEEAILITGSICLVFIIQGIWYCILRHNSAANADGFIALFGTVCAAFFLSLITIGSLVAVGALIAKLEEEFGKSIREEFGNREKVIKKELFEKIDKDLLGDEYEL